MVYIPHAVNCKRLRILGEAIRRKEAIRSNEAVQRIDNKFIYREEAAKAE